MIMKTKLKLVSLMVALFSTVSMVEGQNNPNHLIPMLPNAAFTVNPTVVQTGTHPSLTWRIMYPSNFSNFAKINSNGLIEFTDSCYLSVRPIGVGVTTGGRQEDKDFIHAEARISVNGSSYVQLFYGTNADVDPSYSLYIKKLNVGSTLSFGGRYVVGDKWSSFYTSQSSNMQVVTLVNGDTIPTTFDLVKSDKLTSYLKPYVNGAGKISLGPTSALVLMELGETNASNTGFDYQDVVLILTASSKHPNNGHGNNLDGVDSSNPGQGHGGPNGEVDPSGGVDDEK